MNDQTKPESHFIWLIDGRREVHDVVIQKVIRLASVYQTPTTLIVDRRLRASERSYWKIFENYEALNSAWSEQQAQRLAEVEAALDAASIDFSTVTLDSAKYLDAVEAALKPGSENILILQDEKAMARHPIFQELVNLPCAAFILTPKPWQREMKIMGAIDPLHENARPLDLDFKIVKKTRSLANHLRAAKWHIANACYLPPSCVEYKAKLLEIHTEAVTEYIRQVDVPIEHFLVLKGLPEDAIESWFQKHNADLLVIGLVARNKLMSHLVGSTTIALLNDPPADMLLVKSTPG